MSLSSPVWTTKSKSFSRIFLRLFNNASNDEPVKNELPLPLSNKCSWTLFVLLAISYVLNDGKSTGEEPFTLEPSDDVPGNWFCDVKFICDVRSLSLVGLLTFLPIPLLSFVVWWFLLGDWCEWVPSIWLDKIRGSSLNIKLIR